VSHGDYADGTDRQTDGRQNRYITLSAKRCQRNNDGLFVQSGEKLEFRVRVSRVSIVRVSVRARSADAH